MANRSPAALLEGGNSGASPRPAPAVPPLPQRSPVPATPAPQARLSPVPAQPAAPVITAESRPSPVPPVPAASVGELSMFNANPDVVVNEQLVERERELEALKDRLKRLYRDEVKFILSSVAVMVAAAVGCSMVVFHKSKSDVANIRASHARALTDYQRNSDVVYARALADGEVKRSWGVARQVINDLFDKDIGDLGPEQTYLQYTARRVDLSGELRFSNVPEQNRGVIIRLVLAQNNLATAGNKIDEILRTDGLNLTEAEKASLRQTQAIITRYNAVLTTVVGGTSQVFSTTAVPGDLSVTDADQISPSLGWTIAGPEAQTPAVPAQATEPVRRGTTQHGASRHGANNHRNGNPNHAATVGIGGNGNGPVY